MGNMANPVSGGTLGSRPFVHQSVDVVHEDLSITVDEDFVFAVFEVKYHIDALMDGVKIPFLFYAADYHGSFTVMMDGKAIPLQKVPDDFAKRDSVTKDFSYFFGKDESNIPIQTSKNITSLVKLTDMLYFETDIAKGKHVIEVSYRAMAYSDRWDWVNKYGFQYALSPAKYWKSFGTLDVTLDATAFKEPINGNFGAPAVGHIDSVAQWHFSGLPTDILEIKFEPQPNAFARLLIFISPGGLGILTGLVMLLMHCRLVVWFRKRNPLKRFSWVVILGSLLIPFLFLISIVYYHVVIDFFIGKYASGRHGYVFMIVVFYPFILPFYWVFVWLVDRHFKVKLA